MLAQGGLEGKVRRATLADGATALGADEKASTTGTAGIGLVTEACNVETSELVATSMVPAVVGHPVDSHRPLILGVAVWIVAESLRILRRSHAVEFIGLATDLEVAKGNAVIAVGVDTDAIVDKGATVK